MAAPKEIEELSVCSEETNSVCDEERTRKLFQACDADGDGYIDSNDLEGICRELHLENCIEGLMQELGADEEGKISYEKFLNRKIALRPEIHALKKKHSSRDINEYVPSSSNNSIGKHDCWEFDSGARDLSPEPRTLHRLTDTAGGHTSAGNLLQLANKLHLAAISSLRAEISELNTRLQSVTEERDFLEGALKKYQDKSESCCVQRYEEQITELHSVIAELNKKLNTQQNNIIIEEEDVISEAEYCSNDADKTVIDDKEKPEQAPQSCVRGEESKRSREQPNTVKKHSTEKNTTERMENTLKNSESRRLASSNLSEIPNQNDTSLVQFTSETTMPVSQVAERVKLPKIECSVTGAEISNIGISHTEVAEHIVSELQTESSVQELCRQDKKYLEIETERLHAKLEHLKAQNNTLQISMHKTRENCERMYTLLGKYESNAVALKLFSDSCQKLLDNYDSLVKILTEERENGSIVSREEKHLRANIMNLRRENALVCSTVVELESCHTNEYENRPKLSVQEMKKLDLEMAVLIQDFMEMRETNSELRATIYKLNQERETLELKLAALQSQLQMYAFVKSEDQQTDSADHDAKLQEKLKKIATTLEKVNRNADMRQNLAYQLENTNCALMKTVERCKRKSQIRLRKLETEMITMMEKHAAQVKSLKQRIQFLEELNKDRLSNNRTKETPTTDSAVGDNSSTRKVEDSKK